MKKCPYCAEENYPEATKCKRCGSDLKNKKKKPITISAFTVFFIIFAILSLFVIWIVRFEENKSSPVSTPQNMAGQKPAVVPVSANITPQSNWTYSADNDQMGYGSNKLAWVKSSNKLEFGFPYGGAQRATLTLRESKKYGKNVYVEIERGQFICNIFNCNAKVRFDQGLPQVYRASEAADNSTTVLFIKGYERFLTNARKSKIVRIEATFYQEGDRMLEFDIAGLKW